MQTKSNTDSFERLMNQAAICAQWNLQKKEAFPNAFLFVQDSRVACAWAKPDGSADPFPSFVKEIGHLASLNNITEGVFLELLKSVSVLHPEKCPIQPVPSATEYVLVIWQSRTEDVTLAFPVYRKTDGTFSHLGEFLKAGSLPWVPNIIPKQEPSETERMASERMLQKRKLVIEFQPNELPGKNPMKTLIMNDSKVMVTRAPVDELDEIFKMIVANGGQSILTQRDTPIDVVYEEVDGAARFGYYSKDERYFEALVLSTCRGRQCWTEFHRSCENAMSYGEATGTNLASAVPNDGAWNCVILYRDCEELAEEDFNELFGFHCRLAQVYLRQQEQTPAGEENK